MKITRDEWIRIHDIFVEEFRAVVELPNRTLEEKEKRAIEGFRAYLRAVKRVKEELGIRLY